MSLRYYANAPATTLGASCSNSATSIQVNSVTGFPIQYPYTLILDRGTASEEAVSVTNASGTTLTVTRAIDGTTAFSHSLGAAVEHGVTAQDIREANAHVNASTAVHGLAGAVVGTTDTQALTNKDLTAGNTFPTSLATVSTGQTLTNKTLALGSNTVSGTRAQFNAAMTDDDFASLTGTETLTNKTLTSPTINTPTITNPTTTVSGLTAKPLLICTSSTRPAHAAGQNIYETDTGRTLQSNGTAWNYVELNDWTFGGNRLDSAVANPTTPPTGMKFITGTAVIAFSSGVGSLTFAGTGFANGVISLLAMTIVGSASAPVVNSGSVTKTGAQLVISGLTGNATISYLAIGW